jgi:hypothetical protein
MGKFIYIYNFCHLLQYIIFILTIECLILQRCFRVNNDDKEHANRVLEDCAKKVYKDMTSNCRIQATNAYLKAHKVPIKDFKHHLATFLTVDQCVSVSDSFESMQRPIRPFVSYGLLQNINVSQKRKENMGLVLENTRLGAMDMSVWVNEW